MRKSEQYGLDWKDVDLLSRRVTLRGTKNGSVRHIPLNTVALQAFKTIARRSGRCRGHVFGPPGGSHPVLAHRQWWQAVVKKAQLVDFHWHDTRHHFASKAVMAGVDLRTLQQRLATRLCRWWSGIRTCLNLTSWLPLRSCVTWIATHLLTRCFEVANKLHLEW